MRTVAATPSDIPVDNTVAALGQPGRILGHACRTTGHEDAVTVGVRCSSTRNVRERTLGHISGTRPPSLLLFPSSQLLYSCEGRGNSSSRRSDPTSDFVHASFVGVVALGCLPREITFGLVLRSTRRSPLDNLPRPGRGALPPTASHTVDGAVGVALCRPDVVRRWAARATILLMLLPARLSRMGPQSQRGMGTPPFDSFLSALGVSQIQTHVDPQKSKCLACQATSRMDVHRGSVRPAATCLYCASSGTRDGRTKCQLAQSETQPRQDARSTDRARILLVCVCATAARSVLG